MQLSVLWCRDSKRTLTNSRMLTAVGCGPSPIHSWPFDTLLRSSLCKSTLCCWDVALTQKHTDVTQLSPKTYQGMNNLRWSTSKYRRTVCGWDSPNVLQCQSTWNQLRVSVDHRSVGCLSAATDVTSETVAENETTWNIYVYWTGLYATFCVKVETVIPTETLSSASTVCFHS